MQYLKLIRVYQWVKNTFVFLPLFFAGRLLDDTDVLVKLLVAFFAFSLASGGIYVLNDYMDRESDSQHPEKCKRPLASGEVPLSTAFILIGVLIPCGLIIAYILDTSFFYILGAYVLLNILYSVKLKHIPILDITIIALGFLLRIFGGGVIGDVNISRWLIIMTFLLALFMGLAKRREDVLLYSTSGNKPRLSVDGYNLDFINISLGLMAAVIIVSYIMYTVSVDAARAYHSEYSYLTTIFVILGLLRYLQITMVENKSGSPTKILLRDKFVQITVLGWIIMYYIFIYLP